MNSRLPRIGSIQKLAEFWHAHDLTDFEDDLEEVASPFSEANMELDTKKIDDAVLALLYLGLHDVTRVWKGFDWDAMHRLHEKGFISNPRGKAKSVLLTDEGLERAKRLLEKLFGK